MSVQGEGVGAGRCRRGLPLALVLLPEWSIGVGANDAIGWGGPEMRAVEQLIAMLSPAGAGVVASAAVFAFECLD